MTGFRRSRSRAAFIAAGFLAVALFTGCDEAPSEQSGATVETQELAPGASAQAVKAAKKAQLQLKVEQHGYLFIEGRHRFTQTRRFDETNGVGVTLTNGKVCVSYGKECVEAEVAYRIDSGQELALQKHYVATETLPDEAVIEYWGVDDNGNPVSVRAEIQLDIPKQDVRD